jgi:hypothetical protein
MKYNMAYRRFRHVGKEKVTMDFAFFAMAFNLKKMCAKMGKEALNSLYSMKNTLKKLYSGEIIALNPVEREIGRKWAA